MKTQFPFACLAVLMGACVAGCGKSTEENSGKPKTQTTKLILDHKPADRWEGKVEIIVGGVSDYRKFVASHKGKIVVADMWSTWCEPCLKELPKLAAVQQIYGDKVICVAVALNYDSLKPNDPEKLKEIRQPVEDAFRKAFGKMLGKDGELNAEFRLFISNEDGEQFLNALDGTAQPMIFVYDQARHTKNTSFPFSID